MKNRKKVIRISMLMFLISVLSIMNGSKVEADVWSEAGRTSDGFVYDVYYVDGNVTSVTIIDYNGAATDIVIPETVDGKKVTKISSDAFSGNEELTSVTIPGSFKYVGGEFKDCINLKSITMLEGVKGITEEAFAGLSNLEEITIPSSVATIDCDAFAGTKWLKNKREVNVVVIVNDILIEIGDCSGEVVVPNSVKCIGGGVFAGNNNITSIKMPESVKHIGCHAFYNCTKLTSINIPQNVTSIEMDAFNGCSSLTSIDIPQSVTSIMYDAFSGCSSLTTINIPEHITRIESGVF